MDRTIRPAEPRLDREAARCGVRRVPEMLWTGPGGDVRTALPRLHGLGYVFRRQGMHAISLLPGWCVLRRFARVIFLGLLVWALLGRCINARPLAVHGCVFVDGRLSGRGKV